MCPLREQTASSERPLSSLRQSLKAPHLWCAIVFIVVCAGLADACRKPSNQVGAKIYVRIVQAYRNTFSPFLSNHIRCRFVPSCSEYSIQAVQEKGLITGLYWTLNRISRCRKDVPLATPDPVNRETNCCADGPLGSSEHPR